MIFARDQLGKAAVRQKRYYDQKVAERRFPIGSWVLRYYPPAAQHKLGRPWIGPFLVVHNAQGWTVGIQRAPLGEVKWVHIDHLKPCTTPEGISRWVENPGVPKVKNKLREEPDPAHIPKTVIVESSIVNDTRLGSSNTSSTLEPDNPVIIFHGAGDILSNFFPVSLRYQGRWFDTSEHLYQYRKALVYGTTSQQTQIWQAKSPGTALRRGKAIKTQPDWHEVKVRVMREILWLKVRSQSRISDYLRSTGDRPLIEGTHNMFWGS